MAQKLEIPLATSLLHFQLNKLFKNILALFGSATVLATFQKILGDFFPNHLVTLHILCQKQLNNVCHKQNMRFNCLSVSDDKEKVFFYNIFNWTEPEVTPETTDEEAVLLFGGE
jgi:hypothetical protein